MTLDSLVSEDSPSTARCWCGSCIGKDSKVCPTCATPYHSECWDSIEGCATYGCKERGKVLDELATEFIGKDLIVPSDYTPAANNHISSWYSKIRNFIGLRDDSWIDDYLDNLRSEMKCMKFTHLKGLALRTAWPNSDFSRNNRWVEEDYEVSNIKCALSYISFPNDSRLVNAGEEAFARIKANQSDMYYNFTGTFAFGFRVGDQSFVAYDDFSGDDWAYLMANRGKKFSDADPLISRAHNNAWKNHRVVPARPPSCLNHLTLSCVPDRRGNSEFEGYDHVRAILGQASKPYALWLYRECGVKSIKLSYISSYHLDRMPQGTFFIGPCALSGDKGDFVIGSEFSQDIIGRMRGVSYPASSKI